MERSQELESAFASFLAALAGGDEAAVAHLATTEDAAALIGSDDGEWRTGAGTWAVLPAFVRAFRAGGLRVTPGEPAGYAEGPCGWVIDRPTFRTEAGARTRTRMTAIFRREDGAWRLVHLHNSVGVPDAQVAAFRALAAASPDATDTP
jgi:ketosteroid isomerase-like protein